MGGGIFVPIEKRNFETWLRKDNLVEEFSSRYLKNIGEWESWFQIRKQGKYQSGAIAKRSSSEFMVQIPPGDIFL